MPLAVLVLEAGDALALGAAQAFVQRFDQRQLGPGDEQARERGDLALERAELVRDAGEEGARLDAEGLEHLVRDPGNVFDRRPAVVGGGRGDVFPGVALGDEADDRREGAGPLAQALARRGLQIADRLAEELELLVRLAARL